MQEKRVVIGVMWVEDEPGYDAPQYVLMTDMLDRTERSELSVDKYHISVETLKTIVLSLEDEIASPKIMKNDENEKEKCVPAWARINKCSGSHKKTKNSTIEQGRKKK